MSVLTDCRTVVAINNSDDTLALDDAGLFMLYVILVGVQRYGTFKYGEKQYGASCAESMLLWTLIVDWDADGYFTGENEATRMTSFNLSRGRDYFVRPGGHGFERYQAGQATVILDNDDGRYNPFNPNSSLYPNVTPGKSVRLAVKDAETGTNYSLMYGRIADIQPYNDGNRRMVKIDVVDGQQFLSDRNVRVGFRNHQAGQQSSTWTTGRWVDTILEAAGWPDEWPRVYSLLDDYNNSTYKGLKWAWFWRRDAMEAVRELENAEVGTFLHDRNGQARFFARSFTYDKIVTLDQSQILRDITVPQPWETLRNRVEIGVHQIKAEIFGSPEVLFQTGGDDDDAIPIAAETALVTDVEFKFGSYAVVPLNLYISVTLTDAPDGGSALTHTEQIGERGDGATVIVQNTDATDGYLRNLEIGGDALYSKYDNIIGVEDGESIAIYDTRTFRLDSPWTQENADAELMTAFLLEELRTPTPYPAIRLEDRPDIQFDLDLYADLIHLTAEAIWVNRLFRIGKIEHSWSSGKAVRTTLKLEPYFAYGADVEIDEVVTWDFDSCPDGWEFDPDPGDWSCSIGRLIAQLDDANVDYVTIEPDLLLGRNYYLSYQYRYQNTQSWSTNENVVFLVLITAESGQVFVGFVPFEAIEQGNYTQATVDLSGYEGETLSLIRFIKGGVDGDATAVLEIDNISIGQRID
ncbi:MAG TPA: hypothetical protein VGD99_21850 [Anaerolineae bacterium]|jgi:hypothetical protein